MIPYSEKTLILMKYISELTQLAIDNGDTKWLKKNAFSIKESDGFLNEKMRAYAKRQYKLKLVKRGATAVNITYSSSGTFRVRVNHPGLFDLYRYNASIRSTGTRDTALKTVMDRAMERLRNPMDRNQLRGTVYAGYVIFTTSCFTFGNEYFTCTYINPRGSNSRIYMFKDRLSHIQIVNAIDEALVLLNNFNELMASRLSADEQFINPEGKTFTYERRMAEQEFLSKHFIFNQIKDISELYEERQAK